jgi:hypothetical protein
MRWCLYSMIFFSQVIYAQVPGYMGKRFALFLDANATPAFLVQNINNKAIIGNEDTGNSSRFAFNFRPQASIEYLVNKRVSLGVSYSHWMVGTNRAYVVEPETSDVRQLHRLDADVVRGDGAGIHVKFFNYNESNSIPPIGFYHAISVYVSRVNTYDTRKSKEKFFKNDFITPVATYSWGRQSMIAKNVLLKSGVELGWAFVPVNFVAESKDDWSVQEHSGYNVHASLFGYSVLSVNVALGYIF